MHLRALLVTITILIPLIGRAQTTAPDFEALLSSLASEDTHEVLAAFDVFYEFPESAEPAIPLLIQMLNDDREIESKSQFGSSNGMVSYHAEQLLILIGKPSVAPLALALAEMHDENDQVTTMQMISQIDVKSLPALQAIIPLAQSSNKQVRFYALLVMPIVAPDPKDIVKVLAQGLDDKAPDVRAVAAMGLGQLGPRSSPSIPKLIKLMESEQDSRSNAHSLDSGGFYPVRADVIQAIGLIGTSSKDAVRRIEKLLDDEELNIRIAAAQAHCRLVKDSERGLRVLIQELENPNFGFARERAARALAELGPLARPVLKHLRAATKHENSLIRIYAAEAIAAIHPDDVVDLLQLMSHDQSLLVRSKVMKLLGDLPDRSAMTIDTLIQGLDERSWLVQLAAINALKSKGHAAKRAIPKLRVLSEGEDRTLRKQAIVALEAIQKSADLDESNR